ncbi:MAG: Ti-type conjugative transfer relaxase TraA, partial [Pseudomonadota bacterium]
SMHFELEDRNVSYASKHEAIHSELMLPDETPAWLRNAIDGRDAHGASEALWNSVETHLSRKNAKLAREIEFALPLELTAEQNLDLARDFLQQFTARGEVVDFSYHDLEGNPHIHAMMTVAPLTEDGFGSVNVPVLDQDGDPVRHMVKRTDKETGRTWSEERIVYEKWSGGREDLEAWRKDWADHVNRHLERHGFDERVDHRSFVEQGLDLEPGRHLGPDAADMLKRGIVTERAEEAAEIRERNLDRIRKNPDLILDRLTQHKSVFTADDMSRELFRFVDDAAEFQQLNARLQASEALVSLRSADKDPENGAQLEKAAFTTRDMLNVETQMANRAVRMNNAKGFGVSERHIEAALERYDFLSDEQKAAVRHVTGEAQIAAVVGFAGAGKTTLLKAAREAWEANGSQVVGLALAGKAAEELQQSSGIESRTLASFELALTHDRVEMNKNQVFVVDEAGMVGSRQLSRLARNVEAVGAKLVLSGDPDQLTPISAGAAMRAIVERTGYAEVSGIRRQKEDWQKDASLNFARGDIAAGLEAYRSRDCFHECGFKTEAVLSVAKHVAADIDQGREVLALAHTNKDVETINDAVRGQLKQQGKLEDEAPFPAAKGDRSFAAGDRMVFLQNDRQLGVKNGMLGMVQAAEDGRLSVITDDGRKVGFSADRYDSVDHGYAVTVHKSQGASVDRVHV